MSKKSNRNVPAESGTAPYNFVPLNEYVVRATPSAEQLPDHNSFVGDGYNFSGYLDVTVETLSPLYVRGPLTDKQHEYQETNRYESGDSFPTEGNPEWRKLVKNIPDFFHTGDPSQPVIPGSSLRGMLRSLVEIITYGKMGAITDKNLFYRTVDNSVIGRAYRDRMVGAEQGSKKVETGFLRYNESEEMYEIHTCDMKRVDKRRVPDNHIQGGERNPNATPNWQYQHEEIGVTYSTNGKYVESVDFNGTGAVLVMSGNSPRKKKEFVFLKPDTNSQVIIVPEDVIERFHDDDQISQWQGRAFPKDQPYKDARERNGMLQIQPRGYGDPVFFLREYGRVTFIGRAQMFRLPYLNSPYDLLPDVHKYAEVYDERQNRLIEMIDFADAIFGYVREDKEFHNVKELPDQGSKRRAYAGRVFVTNARPEGEVTFHADGVVTPKILSTPKPTSFQKYLEQTTTNARNMAHYDQNGAKIRGHKAYWHQGENPEFAVDKDNPVPDNSTQHTQMKPVAPRNTFRFRVYFHRLHEIELGALLWALHLPGDSEKTYAHKIGMGKALGLGSVQLSSRLILIDRDGSLGKTGRYEKLFSQRKDGSIRWHRATRNFTDHVETPIQQFEEFMLSEIGEPVSRLAEVDRIKDLLALMEWRRDLSPAQQSRIEDEGYNKGRRRLPEPREVFGD